MDMITSQDLTLEAAREFAAALAETEEYQAFEDAQRVLRRDKTAQGAIRAFQDKQQALNWQLRLGLVSDVDRATLQRLEQAMLALPAVQAYVQAQEKISRLCGELAGLISDTIRLDFAGGCGPGCGCG
ncbi:MAG: YlbF family regulator [Anaerolineae bacterium]